MNFTDNESIILEILKEKYGQEFICLNIRNTGYFGDGTTAMDFYPKGGNPEMDCARAETWMTKDNKREFYDTYFGIIIREDVETEIVATLAEINLPMKAYYSCTFPFDSIFDGTKTYADYKQWKIENSVKPSFDFDSELIVLCEDIENREQYANQIYNELEKANFRGLVSIRVTSKTAIYEKITRQNLYDVFEANNQTMFDLYEVLPR